MGTAKLVGFNDSVLCSSQGNITTRARPTLHPWSNSKRGPASCQQSRPQKQMLDQHCIPEANPDACQPCKHNCWEVAAVQTLQGKLSNSIGLSACAGQQSCVKLQ
ncbi:unnamed protein product [Effrenium voratum]|nr:unnamed protein product [Effrenium voratum]